MAIKSKKIELTTRERRKISIRKRLEGTSARPRVTVFRSSKHIYAQVTSDVDGKILCSASTREKEFAAKLKSASAEGLHHDVRSTKSVVAAKAVGLMVAERCKDKKISTVVFDRNGFLYHGRIKALADGIREGGLKV